ncbi:hypothetical protein D3C78_1453310 [compost metagenome]
MRLPARFRWGATRDHFQSERHSVSTCTPNRSNGPLRHGDRPISAVRICARVWSSQSVSRVRPFSRSTSLGWILGKASRALCQRSRSP